LEKIEILFVFYSTNNPHNQRQTNNERTNNEQTKMATEECNVCYEALNKTTRKKIACEHIGACTFEACKACIRKYVLNTTDDPSCMNCNRAWSDKFLYSQLTQTFMRGEYKIYRKELLVQAQISRLPETMPAVERQKQEEMLSVQFGMICRELDTARQLHGEIQKKWAQRKKAANPVEQIKYDNELRDANETISLLRNNLDIIRRDIDIVREGGQIETGAPKKGPLVAAIPCGNTDCRGYLGADYKCEVCEHHTCGKCLEHIGLVENEAPHVCKPENIESAEFVRKQSKPCPCCSARISKIDGCDQMWCTQCRKAFSWNTGLLVSGPVHNPHFYQYQRENGGLQRNPGDVVCGGMPGIGVIIRKITEVAPEITNSPLGDSVLKIHQFCMHFAQLYVAGVRPATNVGRNDRAAEMLRVRYILKRLTREQLADDIADKDYARKKATSIIHVCDLLETVCGDIFRLIIASQKTGDEFAVELEQHINAFDTLRLYVNDQMKEVSITYNICVQQISAEWENSSSKFGKNGETAKCILVRNEHQRKKRERIEETIRVQREEKLRLQQEQAGRA
jgi:hypothetical protein